MTPITGIVLCDNKGCDWRESVEDVAAYHNAACPKCGHAPVVSDEEMQALEAYAEMCGLGLFKNLPVDAPAAPGRVRIYVKGSDVTVEDRSKPLQ
jgi:hypothetical protein